MNKIKYLIGGIIVIILGLFFLRILPLVKSDLGKIAIPLIVNQILPSFYLFKNGKSETPLEAKQTDSDKATSDIWRFIFNTAYFSALVASYIFKDTLEKDNGEILSLSKWSSWFLEQRGFIISFAVILGVLMIVFVTLSGWYGQHERKLLQKKEYVKRTRSDKHKKKYKM